MIKEHQDKIKQDQKDLQSLSLQIEKVQKLRKQYSQQKQELGSLKHIIYELKNQNQQLRSRSHLQQDEQNKFKSKVNSQSSSSFDVNAGKKNVKSQTWNTQLRNNFEDIVDPQQSKTSPKIWNACFQRNSKIKKLNLKQDNKQYKNIEIEFLQPSLRNHSGYISSGRLLTPQGRNNPIGINKNKKQKFDELIQQKYLEQKIRFDRNYFCTKNRLVDNLVGDLQFELQEKQAQVIQQVESHKQTKKMLKKTLTQNQKICQLNNKLLTNNQVLQKQNEYLKKQLKEQTQIKHRLSAINEDIMLCHNTIAKRLYQQSQLQFMAMDAIYFQFEQLTLNLDKIYFSNHS